MKQTFFFLLTAAAPSPALLAATLIYSNSTTDTGIGTNYSANGLVEAGNHITFGSTERLLTTGRFQIYNEGAAVTSDATLRLYNITGNTLGSMIGSYTLSGVNFAAGTGNNLQTITFALPQVAVGNNIVWTLAFNNGSFFDLLLFRPPAVGSAGPDAWWNTGSGLVNVTPPGEDLRYNAEFLAEAQVPEPATLALTGCALAALAYLRRKRSGRDDHSSKPLAVGGSVKFLLLGALAVSAHAATITHFASAVSVVTAGAEFQNQFNLGPGLASNSSALGIFNGQGAAESSASSNLSTGYLRAAVNAVTYSQPGDTSSTRAVASFGDTFRFSGSVAAGDAVSFILLVSGTYQPSPLFSPDGNQSLIEIQIRTPGGLTVGGLTGDSSIIARRAYRIGPGSNQNSICANAACSATTLETIEVIETFPQVIQFDFVPGGDFDWEIFFRLGATLPDPDLVFAADFSHTAAVTFVGPTAQSGSGVFPGTIPLTSSVPEPNAFWLVGGAFVFLLRHRVDSPRGLSSTKF